MKTKKQNRTSNNENPKREPYTLENLPPLFGQDVLAEALGKTESWCEKARWKGTGPKFKKLDGSVRYSRNDVLDWVNGNTYESTTQAANNC